MTSLFDQWLGTAPQSLSQTQDNPGNYTKYQGGFPNSHPAVAPEDSTIPYWDTPPEVLYPSGSNSVDPWDTIYFASQRFPGIARVKTKKKRRHDIKKSRGRNGATQTFVAFDLAEIDITLSLFAADQLSQLQSQMSIILPAPGAADTQNKGVDIYYPSLAILNIGRVVVTDVDALEPTSPHGMWAMKIHCREWYPPTKKNVTVTVIGSTSIAVKTAIVLGQAQSQAATKTTPAEDSTGTRLRMGSNFTGT